MALSREDFAAAFRALASKAVSPKDLRRAFRVQTESSDRRPLARVLADLGLVDAARLDAIGDPVMPDLASDPAALDALGEMLIADEAATEGEIEKLISDVRSRTVRRTLPAVPPPKSLAGYDVEWELGRGPSGTVYRARRDALPHECALKLFRQAQAGPGFVERAKAAAGRTEPGFVTIHEAGEADGVPYVAMELVEGGSLESLIADRKLSIRRGFEMVEKAARALAAVHAKGGAHGAISAGAILVDRHDAPRITGLGLAAGGTAAADAAALGSVLYEIAAGTPPHVGFHASQLKPPSKLNPQAAGAPDRIVLKAMQGVYPTAAELAADLKRYLNHEEIAEPPPPRAAASPKQRRAAVAAAVLLPLLVVLWLATRGSSSPPGPAPEPVAATPSPDPAPTPVVASKPPPRRPDPAVEDWKRKGPIGINEARDFEVGCSQAFASGDFDTLLRRCDEAVARGFSDGRERDYVHFWSATVHAKRGDQERALAAITKTIELNPARPGAIDLRIEILLRRGQMRRALADLETRFGRNTSEVNRALRELSLQVAAAPGDPWLRVLRGAHLHHKRNFLPAADDFAEAVRSGDSRARYFLALSLAADDRREEALVELRAYLAAHPGDPGAAEAADLLRSLE